MYLESKTGELDNEDRRGVNRLSDADLERVAQRAAWIVWGHFEKQIGKTAIRLFLYVLGAMLLVALAWLGVRQEVRLL